MVPVEDVMLVLPTVWAPLRNEVVSAPEVAVRLSAPIVWLPV